MQPEIIRVGNLDEMCILEYLVKLNFCLDNLEDGTEFAKAEDYNRIVDFVTNFKFNDHDTVHLVQVETPNIEDMV